MTLSEIRRPAVDLSRRKARPLARPKVFRQPTLTTLKFFSPEDANSEHVVPTVFSSASHGLVWSNVSDTGADAYAHGNQLRKAAEFRARRWRGHAQPKVHWAEVPFSAIKDRIAELEEASHEIGAVLSQESVSWLWGFVLHYGITAFPFITLRPNGEVRALWENNTGLQLGVQFHTSGRVGYVVFVQSSDGQPAHHTGFCSVKDLDDVIVRHNLDTLCA